jgi:hypothetical protein
MARRIGQKLIQPYHIRIARPESTVLCDDGIRRNGISPPFMPKSITDEYHPTGNSIGYTIQTAHLMGSEEIYLLGFTLKAGSAYFFGTNMNPATKRTAVYDTHRALDWLSWYETNWPGRARLVEGWDGPIYDVLQKVSYEELHGKFCEPEFQGEWLA